MGYTPEYTITAHLLRLIENISTLKTKIELSTVAVTWIPQLEKEALSKMAHSSTAIEGNPLTLREVQVLAEGGSLPQKETLHQQEVVNYLAALNYIAKHASKKSINAGDILRLHGIVGKNALDREPIGAYRNYQVYVGNHVPPEAHLISKLIDELLEWLNGKGSGLPAIMSSAILHYQFETIHPFGDGNGRVGRILAIWELYRRKFDTHHIFAVDEYFWENRQAYYRALSYAREQGEDLTGWLEFTGEAIEFTLEKVLERINTVSVQRPGALTLSPNQEKLIALLRHTPMGLQQIMAELDISKSGAHFILKPLLGNDIVKRVGGHKAGKYVIV